MFNRFMRGFRRWRRSKRVVPMRSAVLMIPIAALACATPAYRASEVPVPATYDVKRPIWLSTRQGSDTSGSYESGGVRISESLAATPFWTSLGDSVLTALVGEAQRAN